MSSDPPEAFYKPYRPSAPPDETSQPASTRYYQTQANQQADSSKQSQASYPEGDAPSQPAAGYQPYQPYAPPASHPPSGQQPQLPTIYVQEPTPITPSSSIRRRPDGFPVENQGGQPIVTDSRPAHSAEYSLPDRTQAAPPHASGALPPQETIVTELPSEPEPASYVTPAVAAVPPPAREDHDDLYAADLPAGPHVPPPPPPEKHDERPSSSALPLYDHPEGISLEQEYAQPEKSAEKPYPEVVPSGPVNDPPPAYAQPEGVVLDSGAAYPGKTPEQPVPPLAPLPQEYYAPEKAPIAPFVGSASGSAPYRPIPDTPPPLPPRRSPISFAVDDDPSNPVHYTRDPHKLIAYLIPFPKPRTEGGNVPDRFLIYTPPPPPLPKPVEGEKETRSHKIQRKWQEEVRAAKTSKAKAASWAGVKSKATKGISWAMSQTMSANLEFITRMQPDTHVRSRSPSPSNKEKDHHAEDGVKEEDTTHKTVGLEELVLIYPSSLAGTPEQLRTEFVNTMLRSRSKAQRDSIIATGLLPITLAIDILSTPIWPFGGLFEVDAVWAYSSIRGARIARSTTKRLTSTGDNELEKNALQLRFQPSARLDVLRRYLATRCHERNAKRFGSPGVGVTESEVLEAIGWSPSVIKDGERNWEDEQWELQEVKDDLRAVMRKGAREWDRWVGSWESDPKKAAKK